jgi:hypothetical protein
MNAKKLFLNVSEISSFIGRNKYDFITPFERFFKRYDSEAYHRCINSMKTQVNIKTNDIINEKVLLQENLDTKKITKTQFAKAVKDIEEKELGIKEITKTIESITMTQTQKIEK